MEKKKRSDVMRELGKKTQFSKDNQPDPKAKAEGWAKKRLLKDIASEIITGSARTNFKNLAEYLGLDVDAIDLETALHLKQIEKALKKGDTIAYNAVMDRLKGKPLQAIQTSAEPVKPVVFKTIDKTTAKTPAE